MSEKLDDEGRMRKIHSEHSMLRESIVEHLFVGGLLQRLWQQGIYDTEILRSEFDNAGYDLVLIRKQIMRHIQLKATREGGARADVSVGLRLAEKPSGCVLWLTVDDHLNIVGYRFFGGEPGAPLPDIFELSITKHAKANMDREKSDRIAHRDVGKGRFVHLQSMDAVIASLLGEIA